jgi:hypothetical protein
MSVLIESKTQLARLTGRVADWWRRRAAVRRAHCELDADSQETARIARDVHLPPATLHALADRGPDDAALLARRMAVLRLDAEDLARRDGAVMQDLQRLCTLCGIKGLCAAELDWRPQDPRWKEYCPNSGTLTALQARWPGSQKQDS